MTKIVGVYVRVSKIDQHPENQIHELQRFIQTRGWTMYGGQPFVDHGISGAKGADKRPALAALMELAHKRKIQAVLVWDLSRFARSMKHLVTALETFRELNVEFISYQQGIDTTTATGRLMFGVIAALAEFEREMIRERTVLGLIEARANGKKLGRPRLIFDFETMKENLGLSVRKLAAVLSVSPTSAARIKAAYGVPISPVKNNENIVGESL